MKKTNVITTQGDTWKLEKPLRRILFMVNTGILVVAFLFYAYFFTNELRIKDPVIILRNISFPFVPILGVWIYQWQWYIRNVDITIQKITSDIIKINGKMYVLDASRDYIRVYPSATRQGTPLFKISLRLHEQKILIARNLYEPGYKEMIQSLSAFLRLKIDVVDWPTKPPPSFKHW